MGAKHGPGHLAPLVPYYIIRIADIVGYLSYSCHHYNISIFIVCFMHNNI